MISIVTTTIRRSLIVHVEFRLH